MNKKYFGFNELVEFGVELDRSPGGESYLIYGDTEYRTDMGYAFDGIYMFLDALSKKTGNEELWKEVDHFSTRPDMRKVGVKE